MNKKIIFALLIALSLTSIHYRTFSQTKELSLSDIWASRDFFPSSLAEIKPMADGEHYCILEKGEINQYAYKTGKKVKTIFSEAELNKVFTKEKLSIDSYEFSTNETKIIFSSGTESIYRHSTQAHFYVWDIAKAELTPVSEGGKQRLAEFSPNGDKVAFVRDNNMFVKDLASKSEIQITKDGIDRNIIYGTSDWVYEEEFSFTKAFHWSPDGNMIAFYRFDESQVKEFWITTYGTLYPENYKYKYPKAGEDNSVVNILIYNLKTTNTIEVNTGSETNQYIPRIKWTKDTQKLAIQRMNRLQNKLEILIADAASGQTQTIYTEENKYYIDITDDLHFLENGNWLIGSEKNGYNHIYYFNTKGELIQQLTAGEWDVTEIKGIDEKRGIVYYLSAESGPFNRDLYSVRIDGKKKNKLTLNSGWNSVDFSKGFKYFINSWSDANTPPNYSVFGADGKFIVNLRENKRILQKMEEYGFSKLEFFNFKTSENIKLNGWMIKPVNFDSLKKYPIFMYVYGGPGSQTVKNQWGYSNFIWFQMLAQKGYVVISVDNRGTGARGEEFKKMTYLQLGKYETIDQIETAKWLGKQSWVDSKRIGIFGWSYGGYMSTLCLTKGFEYFNAGIAVAPVTNWRYYDNIYTERFMRTPQENGKNYDENSPISHVKKLKGKYLLIHGSADDNVHAQNTYDLVTALVNENKQFDLMIYTNKNHGIYGGNTRFHLYKKMTEFILDNL